MREGRRSRSIGGEVQPPPDIEDHGRTYHSYISRSHIRKRILKRMAWFLPMFFIILQSVVMIVFSPLLIMDIMSGSFSFLFILLLPGGLMIFAFSIAMPIGIIVAFNSITAMNRENYIRVDGNQVLVNLKVAKAASPRKIEFSLLDIRDVIPVNEEYIDERKKDTGYLYRFSYFRFKPLIGDYFTPFSEDENLYRIRLKKPLFAPLYDYKWTGLEDHRRGKNVDEIVVNLGRKDFKRFRKDISRKVGK